MISDKLNKTERETLECVLSFAGKRDRVLLSPEELLGALPAKRKYDGEKLDKILTDLQSDGYFDLVRTDRKGEKMYVIELLPAGHNYKREEGQLKRRVWFKIGLAVVGAVVTFVVGLLLKAVFTR